MHLNPRSKADVESGAEVNLVQSRSTWALVGLVAILLMPSSQSLWIDEGFSTAYAGDATLSEFARRLMNDQGSEALMPLGMLSTWVGARVFGESEFGLRVTSALWVAVAILLMWKLGVMVEAPVLALVFACHPFLWYYGGEVRPYSMVIAMGAGLLLALVAGTTSAGDRRPTIIPLAVFGPLMCGTIVLGVVPVVVVAAIIGGFWWSSGQRMETRERAAVGCSLVSLILIGGYYLQTLARGPDTAWTGPWERTLESWAFAAFELLGFGGFAPGRYELRQLALEGGLRGAMEGLFRPQAIGIAILTAVYLYLAIRSISANRIAETRIAKCGVLAGFAIGASVAVAMAVSVAACTRFWGRHVAFLLPFIVFLVGVVAIRQAKPSSTGRPPVVLAILAITWIVSSLMIRFDPEHGRDDYRSAAFAAVNAANAGAQVWWVAAPEAARYYGVDFCTGNEVAIGCIQYMANVDSARLVEVGKPDLVIESKPELHDVTGAVRGYLERENYVVSKTLLAFAIFRPEYQPLGSQPETQ